MVASSGSEIKEEIKHIAKNTNSDQVYERKTNKKGKFYFNILGAELNISAVSQLYSSKVGLENGIKAAKQFAKLNEIKSSF